MFHDFFKTDEKVSFNAYHKVLKYRRMQALPSAKMCKEHFSISSRQSSYVAQFMT